MQALGEVQVKSQSTDLRQKPGMGALSRGQFMKALGGGALAFGVLTGTTVLSASTASAQRIKPVKSSVLEGGELDRIVRVVAKRKDVVNVMGSDTAQGFSQKAERQSTGNMVTKAQTAHVRCGLHSTNWPAATN